MRLSVAIIARDEADMLPGLLLDVEDIADELVVVDTGSTDNTIGVAEQYGATVSTFPWVDDFAAARNAALDRCSGDWILWLDADDRIPPESRDALAALLGTLDEVDADAVYLDYRLYSPDGTHVLTFPRERLIRRSAGLRWNGRVHETIELPPGSGSVSGSAWVEHRPGSEPSGDPERNLRILREMYTDGDSSPRTLFYLANEYRDHGRVDQARTFYRRRVMDLSGYTEERYAAAYELGKLEMGVDNDVARRMLALAFSLCPWRAEPLRQLEHLSRCSGELAAADALRIVADSLPIPAGLFVEPWAYR